MEDQGKCHRCVLLLTVGGYFLTFGFAIIVTDIVLILKTKRYRDFIPADNESSAVPARAFMTIELVLLYGECCVGQNTNALKRIQLCCASSLIPRQLAAGYLIPGREVIH